jgi:uncharacterized UBP type Zn finger protein
LSGIGAVDGSPVPLLPREEEESGWVGPVRPTHILQESLRDLWSGAVGPVIPTLLLTDLEKRVEDMQRRVGVGDQEDMSVVVHGLLEHYLDGDRLFGFEFLTSLVCPDAGCRAVSYKTDPAMSLQLELGMESQTLDSLLVYHARPELLDPREGWKHDCKMDENVDTQNAVKTLSIMSAPLILIVQLKRFKFDGSGVRGARLDNKIDYPIVLTHIPGQTYRLVAVGRHRGSIQAGHYFAWVRYGETWWVCDDEDVTALEDFSLDSADGARAYMLFYEKVSDGAL